MRSSAAAPVCSPLRAMVVFARRYGINFIAGHDDDATRGLRDDAARFVPHLPKKPSSNTLAADASKAKVP